jgi:hypothetical protein
MNASIGRAVGAPSSILKPPRNVRACNPGNIRERAGDRTQWVGERAADDDPAFEEFETPVFGFRALVVTLRNYRRLYGLKTIRGLIARWAPPSENDTEAYIAFVARAFQLDANVEIDLDNRSNLICLAFAIARKEGGYRPDGSDWWRLEDAAAGVDLALARA